MIKNKETLIATQNTLVRHRRLLIADDSDKHAVEIASVAAEIHNLNVAIVDASLPVPRDSFGHHVGIDSETRRIEGMLLARDEGWQRL